MIRVIRVNRPQILINRTQRFKPQHIPNPNSDPARLGKGLGLGLGLGFRVEGIPSFSMNPYPKPKLR